MPLAPHFYVAMPRFSVTLIVLLLTGCAVPGPLPGVQSTVAPTQIKANPDAQLANHNVEVSTEPAPPKRSPAKQQALETPASDQDWIQSTMARHGIYPPAGTHVGIGSMPPGCEGAHGCTSYHLDPATGQVAAAITILPGQLTEYLLFHEIAHAKGIRDECGADNFARSVIGPVPGHYC